MGQARVNASGRPRADTWDAAEIRRLIRELESFRSRCRVTTLAEIEQSAILDALTKTGWNRSAAAKLLAIHRSTLLRKMRNLGIDR